MYVVGEERAWQVFRLISMKRADDFAHGHFSQLLGRASQAIKGRGRAGQGRVEGGGGEVRGERCPVHDKSWLERVWLRGRRRHSMSCQGCERCFPPFSLSSQNVAWSWISTCAPNVCSAPRLAGPQEREGAATRCGGCVWTLFRAAEDFAREDVPDGTRVAFLSAPMTALQKPNEGVR